MTADLRATALDRGADAGLLARRLLRLGPHALALVRRGDVLTVHVRGERTSAVRHTTGGCAVELIDGEQGAGMPVRRHLFGSHATLEGVSRLLDRAEAGVGAWSTGTAGLAVGVPGGPSSAQASGGLPDALLAAVPALLEAVADRMLTASVPGLVPMLTADVTREVITVLRGDGTVAADDRLRLELRIGARIAGHDGARALRVHSACDPAELTTGDRHLRVADEVVLAAAERIDGVDPPEGELPVVLGPGGPAALLHEVCGHGLEADVAGAPGAAYPGPLGRRVAAPAVTIVDDPAAPAHAPLYRVDDEGVPATRNVLIDRGVLTGYLTDLSGARRTGRPPTGNGRRVDHTHPALARMSCTYLEPGDCRPDEALAGIRSGLYVRSIVAGETDMSGGEFTATVTEGYLIEHGRLTAPIRSARLSGTGAQVLARIDRVCHDLDFLAYGFQCNKLSQFPLTVSVGQPTIRVTGLGVGPR